MGLTNAPQQFQQMIDDRLEPIRDIASPYIDDILVGTTVGEGEDLLAAHDRDVRRAMETLKKEQFVVDDKAKFFLCLKWNFVDKFWVMAVGGPRRGNLWP